MQEFEIVPLKGVGPIRLGMTRKEVHAVLGEPEHARDEREGFLSGFMVDFNADDRVEFIELAKSKQFRAVFKGKCLHEMLADDAVAHVAQYADYDRTQPEPGYSFIFLDLQLSLWRPTLPTEDQPLDDPGGRYFHAVGIAERGYFLAGGQFTDWLARRRNQVPG